MIILPFQLTKLDINKLKNCERLTRKTYIYVFCYNSGIKFGQNPKFN